MKKYLASGFVFLFVFITVISAQVNSSAVPLNSHAQQPALHRVVIQVSTADTLEQKSLFNNLRHIKEGWGNHVRIEVVVHGPGIALVNQASSILQEQIAAMRQEGVLFVVCENTMKQRGITKDQILPGIGFVPSGIREIILKQEEGWSYLKAGF